LDFAVAVLGVTRGEEEAPESVDALWAKLVVHVSFPVGRERARGGMIGAARGARVVACSC
jgi:hypothetical protein